MKKIITKIILLVLGIVPGISICQAQFSAELTDVKQGHKKTYMVSSDGNKYRYDFEEDNTKGIVIVDPGANRTAVLFPAKKFVHYTDLMSSMSLMNDPFQSFRYMQKSFTEKKLGVEKISGFDAQKMELYEDDQKVFTAWYSEELRFLLKMISHVAENTYMELTGINQRNIDSGQFKIPDDYIEVDNRMRAVIPEPPPPESWKTIEATIPVKGEFNRGDLITIRVPESRNYKVILKNQTAEPAKIIRISMKDGKELPGNEQGPLSYRTRRLFKEESSIDTYSWKAGEDKVIQVHEGKIYIEVIPEIR